MCITDIRKQTIIINEKDVEKLRQCVIFKPSRRSGWAPSGIPDACSHSISSGLRYQLLALYIAIAINVTK